jgi:hypothetical protein
MSTQDDLLTTLRAYVRERAPEVSFIEAVREIALALAQIKLHGTGPTTHANPPTSRAGYL